MITTRMKTYNYYLLADSDEYGQAQITPEAQGQIKMALSTTSQSVQDNINYKDANYIGLTLNEINDKYIIEVGEEKLKVLYAFNGGRFKQAFLTLM